MHRQQGRTYVTLSRRNLLTLLAKLDLEGSACTIMGDKMECEGELLMVTAEEDFEHYGDRRPGPMSEETEFTLAEHALMEGI